MWAAASISTALLAENQSIDVFTDQSGPCSIKRAALVKGANDDTMPAVTIGIDSFYSRIESEQQYLGAASIGIFRSAERACLQDEARPLFRSSRRISGLRRRWSTGF